MKIKDNVVDIVIKLLFFYGVWNEGNKYNVIIKRNKVNRNVVNFIVLQIIFKVMFMGKVCKGKLISCCSKGKVKVI